MTLNMGLFDRFKKPEKQNWVIGEAFKGDKDIQDNWQEYGKQKFNFTEYCRKFAYYYDKYPQIKSATIGIAGQVRGEGTFVVEAENKDTEGEPYTTQRSKDAANLIRKLNKRIDVDQLIFDTALRMVKYGTSFIEKDTSGTYSVQLINPKYQPYLKPEYKKNSLIIDAWTTKQRKNGKGITWKSDEISVFAWDVDVNWPYGTSLLTGVDNEVQSIDRLRQSSIDYAKQNAYPFDVIQVGDSEFQPGDTYMNSLRSSIKNRGAGGIQVTNAPVSGYTAGAGSKGVDFVTDQMKFHRDQLSDGLIAPPLSKLYDSTEASAKVTRSWVREVLINPIQHIISTKFEKEIYQPYLLERGYSIRNIPSLEFNIPETMRADEITAIATLVAAKVITPMQACKDLGYDYDEAYWMEQQKQLLKLSAANKPETKPNGSEEEKSTQNKEG